MAIWRHATPFQVWGVTVGRGGTDAQWTGNQRPPRDPWNSEDRFATNPPPTNPRVLLKLRGDPDQLRRTNRTRLGASLAICVLVHLGLLALLAREHPVLKAQRLGPAVFEVTVVPMFLPDPVRNQPPQLLRRVRPARLPEPPADIPPLVVPQLTPLAPAAPLGPPPHLTPELGATLRRSMACANIASPSLSQAERDACLAQLGAGAKAAPDYPPGFSAEKQGLLDAAAAAKEANRRYRDSPIPPPSHCDIGCSPHDLTGAAQPTPKHPF